MACAFAQIYFHKKKTVYLACHLRVQLAHWPSLHQSLQLRGIGSWSRSIVTVPYPGNMAFLSWCGGPVARLKRLTSGHTYHTLKLTLYLVIQSHPLLHILCALKSCSMCRFMIKVHWFFFPRTNYVHYRQSIYTLEWQLDLNKLEKTCMNEAVRVGFFLEGPQQFPPKRCRRCGSKASSYSCNDNTIMCMLPTPHRCRHLLSMPTCPLQAMNSPPPPFNPGGNPRKAIVYHTDCKYYVLREKVFSHTLVNNTKIIAQEIKTTTTTKYNFQNTIM